MQAVLSPWEQIVKDCQCINEFAEAAVIMQSLRQAGKDLICTSGQKGMPPMRHRVLHLLLIALFCPVALRYGATLSCGKDLDGDGKATGRERRPSVSAMAAPSVPSTRSDCTADDSEPTCPAGGVFVPERDRCEAPLAGFVCSLTGQSRFCQFLHQRLYSGVAACRPLILRAGYLCPLNRQSVCDAATPAR